MNDTSWLQEIYSYQQFRYDPIKVIPHSKFMLRLIAYAGYLEIEDNR